MSSTTDRTDRTTHIHQRPGWPEITAGLLTMLAAIVAVPLLGVVGLDTNPVVYGVILTAWSGVASARGVRSAFAAPPGRGWPSASVSVSSRSCSRAW
jgi:hypothetical protein